MKSKKKLKNGHACHPIMRKGGVHEASKTGKRRQAKNELNSMVKAWHDHASSLTAALISTTHSFAQ